MQYSLCMSCNEQIEHKAEYGPDAWYHRVYQVGSEDSVLNNWCQNGADPATTAIPNPEFMIDVPD